MSNGSPPSRAAWIEMKNEQINAQAVQSPPSRAAWIEILPCCNSCHIRIVAAFTGGVD